jgi:hypothetical protein
MSNSGEGEWTTIKNKKNNKKWKKDYLGNA